jgi:peptidyl-prolyl cis-trans isomerase D
MLSFLPSRESSYIWVMRLLFLIISTALLCPTINAQLDAFGKSYTECANDSAFAIKHSVQPIYTVDFDIMYREPSSPPYLHRILDSPIGTVAGPVMENGLKVYYKSIDADSSLEFHTAHIIVAHSMHPDGGAKQLIEEAYAKLQAKVPWTKVVDEYSEDGTIERDGDLDWANESMFVPSFSAACKKMKKDDMTIVETEYGWHIIWMKSKPRKTRAKVTCLRLAVNP